MDQRNAYIEALERSAKTIHEHGPYPTFRADAKLLAALAEALKAGREGYELGKVERGIRLFWQEPHQRITPAYLVIELPEVEQPTGEE